MATRGRTLGALGLVTAGTLVLLAFFFLRRDDESAVKESAAIRTESPLTYPVRWRRLPQRVLVSGTAEPGRRTRLGLPCSDAGGIVTSVTARSGTKLRAGSPVVGIEGKQVLAIPGSFPYYRDLRSGDTGPDVRQLRAALAGGRFPVGRSGPIDSAVIASVRQLQFAAGSWSSAKLIDHCRLLTVPDGAIVNRLRKVVVGEASTEGTIEVNSGRAKASVSIDGEAGPWLKPGASFRGSLKGSSSTDLTGTVISLGTAGGRSEAIVALSTNAKIAPGTEVTGTIVPKTLMRRGLVVPVAAVYAASDGTSYVERSSGRALERVRVEPLLSSGGWVRVRGRLADGDLVTVGVR